MNLEHILLKAVLEVGLEARVAAGLSVIKHGRRSA